MKSVAYSSLAFIFLTSFVSYAAQPSFDVKLAALEKNAEGRLGLALIDTASGERYSYRGDERFPLTSTFKVLAAGAVLKKSEQQPDLLNKHIAYQQSDLVAWSPVLEKHVAQGMKLKDIAAAAIEWSDNTAGNVLLKEIGGPSGIAKLAATLGDNQTRLDRWEPHLNTAIPGDERDTTTPDAMANNLQKLVAGDALAANQKQRLQTWLKQSQTGAQSIRAGTPGGWTVGDKTGAGDYGTTNDVAVIWPPGKAPLVLTVYFTQHKQDAQARRDVLAKAAEIVLQGK
ncbi:class A beta-lactamase [Dryocola boscaweniae]|uniref:class A beta-lactamase n=1 Tax=Dryocola boscaweniae TaxID=2925397 RepID=UPI0034DD5BFE